MQDKQDVRFETKDTSFAAYLLTEGIELLDVDTDSFPSVFVFVEPKEIAEYKRKWQVSSATGNLCVFFQNYKKCLRLAHNGK